MACDLFIFAGEKSGDLHGEKLLKALLDRSSSLKVYGVAGPLMRALPLKCVLPMEEFQVMGFVDVFLALPKLRKLFYFVAQTILELQPQVVVTIDYPGFNLRLARFLRKKGFQGKLVHFICPSVWAHGKQRIPLMAKTLDLLLCILPFEPFLFKDTGLKTCFVGHPLSERILSHLYKPLPFHTDKKLLSLFPGSRKKEIERNLPTMLKACLLEGKDFQIALSLADERFRPLVLKILQEEEFDPSTIPLVPYSYSYELMKASNVAIAKSGTVTVELALHKVPTIVVYAVSFLDKIIAYHLLRIRLKFYCLVNIIAEEEVFPELIGPHLRVESLAKHLKRLQTPEAEKIKEKCTALIHKLGSKKTSTEAADAILRLFS